MDNQAPVRKKWSERQFELFAEAAKEIGQGVSRDDFERAVDRILPTQENGRKRKRTRRGNGVSQE